MFAKLLPRSAPFFTYFRQQSIIMKEMAELLDSIMTANQSSEEDLKKLAQLEDEADNLRLTILQDLAQTFITPIDREDIYAICTEQERVIDSIHGLGARFFLLSFVHIRFPAKKMINDIIGMTKMIGKLVDSLGSKSYMLDTVKEIQALKENAEMLLVIGLGELQDEVQTSLDQIKQTMAWSQLYDRIEQTLLLLSDLTDTLEQVVLKYA